MATFLCKTKDRSNPKGKPRVYFTCHPEDFERHFERICKDIFRTHDCAVYYTEDMTQAIEAENLAIDLGQMNLFIVPVTLALLTKNSRAMEVDLAYARQEHIPILPFMMEPGLEGLYSRSEVLEQRQYLTPNSTDPTEIRYEDKLRKYLESVLISDEMAKRVRGAFDAYIFLSYRKKDRRYANELMKLIHDTPGCRDIAIWYDEFLTPGETFTDNIRRAMKGSQLFALLVTPNLLEEPEGKPNFVMGVEYPEARMAQMKVLPAEIVPTDHGALAEKFQGIPACCDPRDALAFQDRLLQDIEKLDIKENNTEAEHNYLIGLAYLEGIDVEVDRLRGFELISSAAEAGLPEAMKRLMEMYRKGQIVPESTSKAKAWGGRLLERYAQLYDSAHPDKIQTLVTLGDLERSTAGYSRDHDTLTLRRALRYYQSAWDFHTGKHGEINSTSFRILQRIGSIYDLLDQAKAIEVQKRLYEIEKALSGETHEYTIIALSNWAIACSEAKDHTQARDLLLRAWPLAREHFGNHHKLTLDIAQRLGHVYTELGRLQHALDILTKEYTEADYTETGDPQTVTNIFCTIANIYKKAKLPQKELAYWEKAYWHQQRIPGKKKWDLLSTTSMIDRFQEYQDHAGLLAFLWKAYEGQRQDLGEAHEDVLKMLFEIAKAYQKQGDHARALEALRKLYSIQYLQFQKEPAESIWNRTKLDKALEEMSKIHALQGEAEKADFYQSKANLNRHLDILDPHRKRLTHIGEIGSFYEQCGDHNTALKMGENAYTEKVRELGNTHRDSLCLLKALAEGFFAVENYPKALDYSTTVLMLQRHYLEEDHPYLLHNLKVLAQLCRKLELHDQAEEAETYIRDHEAKQAEDLPETEKELCALLYSLGANNPERKLAIQKKRYLLACRETGELSADAFDRLYDLAHAHESCKNYAQAIELLQKLHALATKVLGASYSVTINCNSDSVLESLSRCYLLSGNTDKAIEAAEARYRHNYERNGPKFHGTRSALRTLALTYRLAGKLDKAAEALEIMYADKVAQDGDSFISTGPNGTRRADDTLLEDMVSVYAKLGKNARLVQLCEKLCAVRTEIYGIAHNKTLTAMTWLGYAYREDGQHQKALEITKDVYRLRVQVSGEDAPATLTVLNNLAAVYGDVNDHQTALTLQKKLYALQKKLSGDSHPQTLKALKNLMYACDWAGNYETALEYAQAAYDLHCRIYGTDHTETAEVRDALEAIKKKMAGS